MERKTDTEKKDSGKKASSSEGTKIDKVEWLSWKGYSERKRVSLNGWTSGFAFPTRIFEKIPYCIESYSVLRELESEKRIQIQQSLFDKTSHSVMATSFMGIINPTEFAHMKEQLTLCLHTAVRLMQIVATDDIEGKELKSVLASIPEGKAKQLKTVLQSSLYFYANGTIRKPFEKVLKDPLYLELGIDILSNRDQLQLAEFQVRYALPYPHLMQDMSDAYADLLPELFKQFGLKGETFLARRNALLKKALQKFSAKEKDEPTRLVIDAWAYLENSGANLKSMADDLEMEYVLFDDLHKAQNLYERANRKKRLAIFNQPPLNLLDPDSELFHRLNVEKFEDYDELAWVGLLEKYLKGEVFLANSPIFDLLNDKALYPVLPALSQHFFGKEISLPIVPALPCWSLEDHNKPYDEVLAWARVSKDQAVIAHRYLEGGLGIVVGPATTQAEWESFIETFVMDRPYLYVVRDFFEMDPDFSLRFLAAMYAPKLSAPISKAQTEVSDTIFARMTTQSPLSTDNHRSFLIFSSAEEKESPRYIFDQ